MAGQRDLADDAGEPAGRRSPGRSAGIRLLDGENVSEAMTSPETFRKLACAVDRRSALVACTRFGTIEH